MPACFRSDSERRRWVAPVASLLLFLAGSLGLPANALAQPAEDAPQNVIFILSDDHRYDFMGFHEEAPDFLETPAFDRMAREGAHLSNAFVTTSLCSPSRASILTGQYAHRHGVVDNSTRVPDTTRFFPENLQENGYQTAFVGKWHMGRASAEPRPGFDHWVSFRGQGVYSNPTLNVNGDTVQRDGYMTDLLTDYALDWLKEEHNDAQPFFLYLSHKAVHANFEPAPRHEGMYDEVTPPRPETMANTESNYRGKPEWVKEQRYSWHGVDYMYHGALTFNPFYRNYAETLQALDESVGRVLDYLEQSGLAENTLVVYMGDNGFLLGEHGLIDKRHAYEESIRVPMLAWAPGYIPADTTITTLVRNIDVAPTMLDLTDTRSLETVDGRSFRPLLEGRSSSQDRDFLYEYYWEYAFPQTPTTFALRGDRYKLIMYHGIWDQNEFYDLKADPIEQHNLIHNPTLQDTIQAFQERLFERLRATDGMQIPLRPMGGWQAGERLRDAE
jgi:N-acetylglucosamine-6-sulfatase